MTEIELPYGDDRKRVPVPAEIDVEFISPSDPPALDDLDVEFRRALDEPVGNVSLREVRAGSRVVILVADITRSAGTDVLLPRCLEHLRTMGVEPTSIKVIVARGTHRSLTKHERDFFRNALPGVVVEEHDCDKPEALSALMLTRRGTPVRINAALKDADSIILLSPISFHYFAGFGGGRKLILPGCADRASILANHKLALRDTRPVKMHPKCRSGVLEGNPVHEDMCEPLAALRHVVGINFFADAAGEIAFINCGHPVRAHREACETYRRARTVHVEEPCDVLLASAGGRPHDLNLLQAHKGLRHAAAAVREGGTILFYAECAEGVGSRSLEGALAQERDLFLGRAYTEYDLNNQTAVSLYDLTARFEIGMVSAMNVDVLLAGGIKPCVNPEAFLIDALDRHRSTRMGVLTLGAAVLPRVA